MTVYVLVGSSNLVRATDVVGVYASRAEAERAKLEDRYSDYSEIYERELTIETKESA